MTTIIIFALFISFVIFSIIDLKNQHHLNKRKKINLLFLIIVVPFGGSIIYYLLKPSLKDKK